MLHPCRAPLTAPLHLHRYRHPHQRQCTPQPAHLDAPHGDELPCEQLQPEQQGVAHQQHVGGAPGGVAKLAGPVARQAAAAAAATWRQRSSAAALAEPGRQRGVLLSCQMCCRKQQASGWTRCTPPERLPNDVSRRASLTLLAAAGRLPPFVTCLPCLLLLQQLPPRLPQAPIGAVSYCCRWCRHCRRLGPKAAARAAVWRRHGSRLCLAPVDSSWAGSCSEGLAGRVATAEGDARRQCCRYPCSECGDNYGQKCASKETLGGGQAGACFARAAVQRHPLAFVIRAQWVHRSIASAVNKETCTLWPLLCLPAMAHRAAYSVLRCWQDGTLIATLQGWGLVQHSASAAPQHHLRRLAAAAAGVTQQQQPPALQQLRCLSTSPSVAELDAEVAVIGAGVVGLAVARELALRGRSVLLLEAAPSFGTETSSRSSEVIHAGEAVHGRGPQRARTVAPDLVAGQALPLLLASQSPALARQPAPASCTSKGP